MKTKISKTNATVIAIVILFFIIFLPRPDVTVKAESENYLRVITLDTVLYSDKNLTKPLFYLPYTYYIKVLDETDNTVHAEIGGINTVKIDGYVEKDKLFFDDQEVLSPYPEKTLTTITSGILYEDSELKHAIQYIFDKREMVYYGEYKNNENRIYYVSYNGKLGYVTENCLTPFTIEEHPNKKTFIKETTVEDPPTERFELTNELILRIIIIGSLLLAGIIGLIYSVKKKPKKEPVVTYYDENDFE